jgi:cytochrome P450
VANSHRLSALRAPLTGHFCLGAALARMEIRVILDALLRDVGSLDLAGPVEFVRSNKHTGVRHMPVTLTAR